MISLEVIGRIGKGGEMKQIGYKQAYCFSVASNEKQNGQNVTTWIDVVFFRVQSGLIQYLQQGTLVRVVGNPSWRVYVDKSGQNRVGVSVFANDINLLAMPENGLRQNQQQGYPQQQYQEQTPELNKAAAEEFFNSISNTQGNQTAPHPQQMQVDDLPF